MYAVTGITGQVGGAVARALLDANRPVRAIMRDARKSAQWQRRRCEIAPARMDDASALTAAFAGTDGVFVLLPPIFDPAPGFPEVHSILSALRAALDIARPKKVVCLSTIGAHAIQSNLLKQLGIMEQRLGDLPMPIAFVRAAWFMENFASDVPSARAGIVPSFLQPLDKRVPMVATVDIGRVAAAVLQQSWNGREIIELEGPRRVAPNDVAAEFERILGHSVHMEAVPRTDWESIFKTQGMKNPLPRIQMIDGFNEGWIEFEGGESGSIKGDVELETVVQKLVERAR